MGRGLAVRRKSTKLELLQHIAACTRAGQDGLSPLMTSDDYARDHVLLICESLQLGLTRLFRNPEGYGYELRITRAGRLLAAGEIEAAATALDRGGSRTRLAGEPPEGILGTLLSPGGKGLSLYGSAARHHAPEMIRGVATGHLSVADGFIHAAGTTLSRSPETARDPGSGALESRTEGAAIRSFPTSRSARNIAVRKP
ncbi:hypothetical protein [Methylobacterium marchantiae]|uniref:Uncharacterized protein n=1 Tax=Methylobacterium marchantiae TaxID=600331 RepID=A0ABW3X2H3_9HYPH|nr:hypothetical protein AIGOOFII_1348 [Methylobacterium marchantiae]